MFGKVNLYTALTFIVYPIFVAGLLMFLFFTCTNHSKTALHLETKVAVDEESVFEENVVIKDVSVANDSLYISEYDVSIDERCQ